MTLNPSSNNQHSTKKNTGNENKNSKDKKALIVKERLMQNLWIPSLFFIIFLFALPIWTILEVQQNSYFYQVVDAASKPASDFFTVMDSNTEFVKAIVLIFGLFAGWNFFIYVHNESKVDYYHGLPITRQNLFLSNLLAANIGFAVVYWVNLLAAVLIFGATYPAGLSLTPILWYMFLFQLIFNLFFLVGALAATLTGTKVTMILMTIVLLEIVQLSIISFREVIMTSLRTFDRKSLLWDNLMLYSSPVSAMYQPFTYPLLFGMIALTVGIGFLALWLYKSRPSEVAGLAVRGKIFPQVLKYVILFGCSLLGGIMFREVGRGNDGWLIFGILFTGFFGHLIIEGIYHFDIKKVFTHFPWLIGFLVLMMALLFAIRADLFGYDSKYTGVEKVSSYDLSIDDYMLNQNNLFVGIGYKQVNIKSEKGKQILDQMIQAKIKELETEKKEENSANSYGYYRDASIRVTVNPSTGPSYTRMYSKADNQEYMDALLSLYELDEYAAEREAAFGKGPLTFMNINYIYSRNRLNQTIEMEKTIGDEVLEAIKQDLKNANPGNIKNQSPIAIINFEMEDAYQEDIDRDEVGYYEYSAPRVYLSYPIFESSTNTLLALKKYNLEPEPIRAEDVSRVILYSPSEVVNGGYVGDQKIKSLGNEEYAEEDYENPVIITNQEDIAKILRDYSYAEGPSYNMFLKLDSSTSGDLELKSGDNIHIQKKYSLD